MRNPLRNVEADFDPRRRSLTGRRHDATGRSTGRFANSKFRKANQPPQGEPWVWFSRAMMESPAFRAMSGGAHKVISRIILEHMAHGGGRNGALPVTYSDFVAYGIRRSSILPYLAEAWGLGFIRRTQRGKFAHGDFEGVPALYRLTWLPTHDDTAATN